jgi:hypothetical protein
MISYNSYDIINDIIYDIIHILQTPDPHCVSCSFLATANLAWAQRSDAGDVGNDLDGAMDPDQARDYTLALSRTCWGAPPSFCASSAHSFKDDWRLGSASTDTQLDRVTAASSTRWTSGFGAMAGAAPGWCPREAERISRNRTSANSGVLNLKNLDKFSTPSKYSKFSNV